tara:strand:- start:556 stop:663 length:108 start_codon:yes stop_codon:yes gene_type:complete
MLFIYLVLLLCCFFGSLVLWFGQDILFRLIIEEII